jgi:replication factor C subunit 1
LLKGNIIVLSGLFSVCSRDKLDTFLKNNGAKVTGSISGKTSFLIVGSKLEDGRTVEEGNKYKAAKTKGTKIIKEDMLDNWCKEQIGVGLDEIFGETNISKLYKASEKKVEADP